MEKYIVSSKIKRTSFVLLVIILFGFFVCKFVPISQEEDIEPELTFQMIGEDKSSKFSLVQFLSDQKRVLGAFDRVDKKTMKELHRNDFWSPESCAAMPNTLVNRKYLSILDVKKNKTTLLKESHIFIFDVDSDILFRSDAIDNLVGDIYSTGDGHLIFFTYQGDILRKHFLNPETKKVVKSESFKIKEKSPRFVIDLINDVFFIKIITANDLKIYKILESKMSSVKEIPERDFWYISNLVTGLSLRKGEEHIVLQKKEDEVFRPLRQSSSHIVFSKSKFNHIFDFSLVTFNLENKFENSFFTNNKEPISYFILSID